jgi:hypothetical protein
MRPRTLVIIVAFAVLLYVIAVVWIYGTHLRALPFSRTDPGPWGQFGDYIGGLLNPLFALLNVVVVLYIAASLQRLNEFERRQTEQTEQRIQAVMQLHREWNGEALYRSRISAGNLIRRYPRLTLFEIEEEEPYVEVANVWVVVGFFQRLLLLVLHQKVDEKMTLDLFAELFVWWWVLSYERQLTPCDCDASRQISKLKAWFYENTSEEARAPWLHRARRDRAAAEEQSSALPFHVM